MPRLYLGVDGGGTNCRLRLADESLATLGEVKKGRANLQIDNGEPGYQAILEGTRELFASLGIPHDRMRDTYACFGMAGGRSELSRRNFAARAWPFGAVRVLDDIDIAHAGALGGGEGAVIIAGTGSAALAIVGGERFQCGGWGFLVGDQMSGAILGRELIRYAVEAHDELAPASDLTRKVIALLGGGNGKIMDWAFGNDFNLRIVDAEGRDGADDPELETLLKRFQVGRAPAEYGQRELMDLLFEHYEAGDPVALEMMELEMSYVDRYVKWFKDRGSTRMAVVGGLADRLFPLLKARYGDFLVERRHEPLDGALILAKQSFPPA